MGKGVRSLRLLFFLPPSLVELVGSTFFLNVFWLCPYVVAAFSQVVLAVLGFRVRHG